MLGHGLSSDAVRLRAEETAGGRIAFSSPRNSPILP
jgi:hypothetical protein